MKKKFLNLFMVGAMVFAATSSFVSCKDSNGDDYAELKAENAYLEDYIDAQAQALQSQLDILKQLQEECKTTCNEKWQQLQNQINDLNGDSIKSLRDQVADLKTQDGLLQQQITSIKNTLTDYDSYKQQVNQNKIDISTLTTQYNNLNTALSSVKATAETGMALAKQDSVRIDDLTQKYIALGITADEALKLAKKDSADIADLVTKYTTLNNSVTTIQGQLSTMTNQITVLRDSVQKTYTLADAAYKYAEANKNLIDSLGYEFSKYYTKAQIDSMKAVYKAQIDTAQKRADDAYALAKEAKQLAQDALTAAAQALTDAKDYTDLKVGELNTTLTDLINNKYNDLNGRLTTLEGQFTTLNGQVADLLDRVGILESDVANIKNDIAKMITGIIIQGAQSPVVGQFSLPVGLQSNILFSFWGKNTKGDQANWPKAQLTYAERQVVGNFDTYAIYGGETLVNDMEGGKSYLGTLYTTINPNTVDFTGQTISIVNSQDEESGAYVAPLMKSDKELTFGYTRAANNGFYECPVYCPVENIEDIRITKNLDKDKLKQAAKDVLNALRKRSLSGLNLTDIYKTIIENMGDVIPAYGLKASWKDAANVEHSVYSNYGLAVTSLKPASYDFLKDANLPTLPTIDHISYNVDFHLDYPSFNYIETPDLKLTVYIVYLNVSSGGSTVKSVIGVYSNETDAQATVAANPGSWKEAQTFTVQGLQSFIDQINNDIIKKLTNDIKDLEDQIVSQTQDQVNKALNKVNTKVVDRVNNIINKINARIKNANYYLQPLIIAEGEDGKWYKLSTKDYLPTTVKGAGGMLLEPTSITAELLAPAFKKFVCVTNVWKTDNPTVSAQTGDADCKARADYANEGYRMKTVIDDGYDVLFQADKTGYTYEVTYVAVDFSGVNRVTKYYIKTID